MGFCAARGVLVPRTCACDGILGIERFAMHVNWREWMQSHVWTEEGEGDLSGKREGESREKDVERLWM